MNANPFSEKRFSFEFSAPKSEDATRRLKKVHDRLCEFDPHFFSVTYGAGGSTKDGTRQAVLDIKQAGSEVAPHLSFGGDSREKVERLLLEYKNAGINRIVALRGDAPSGMSSSGNLIHADKLVTFIREKTGDHFHIEVAAYPETHPESTSVDSDLKYFKQKVDAGANGAITQYFYNADAYFRFVDSCRKLQVDVPIVPGIMPITNYRGLVRFSNNCGAEIPRWVVQHLQTYENDPESMKSFADEVVADLCRRLLEGGAPGIHFYTLNKSMPTIRIWRNLGL
ncbi:MAG: methylenetetrahydrofolate reductase [NAD(P)H] [Arenicellales bacterium]|jgi:methylenetetrahydrofolate reductase (NADPH)|nr:methylenetetrahydrofolate reductase [NAD(P)H] [Arenicellales bacterium]|tara:strand:+ start:7714 stop:8559 length:846 start_codon:yes stop_codon:yes gene_type:complete